MDGGEQQAGGMTAEYAAGGGDRQAGPPALGRWEHGKGPNEATDRDPGRAAGTCLFSSSHDSSNSSSSTLDSPNSAM